MSVLTKRGRRVPDIYRKRHLTGGRLHTGASVPKGCAGREELGPLPLPPPTALRVCAQLPPPRSCPAEVVLCFPL